MNMTIEEAVEFFVENWDLIPVLTTIKGDYAVPVKPKRDVYLVVEKNAPGIFLARLAPDLMRLKPLDEPDSDEARQFIYRRLKEANLVKEVNYTH
ncbi:hypothetical protein J2Z49_002045 [Desulfofundulus luciae]|uniref:Uncharacterized protein n=1 Tax=Desulfofundulus luciae TaxID=74702 RepID=A0ABU0B651_9FIRM|nr:hypothetical protein [Desulfofundulus luciae]MDQ0286928.1 hypothetical protein [Desulfofundulus luciae]